MRYGPRMTGPANHPCITLRSGAVEAVLVPSAGGRIGSLTVDGLKTLVTEGWGPLAWGAYPMVPWAGRLAGGVLTWRGEEHRFPTHVAPPHAIHGTLLERAWEVASATGDAAELRATLDDPWPFGGVALFRVRVAPDRLESEIEVRATDRPFPAIVGWHPWFARVMRDAAGMAHGGRVEVDLPAAAMLHRGADGLPDGSEVRPIPPGPWDDCFVELAGPPSVTWAGALRIEVESDAPCVVVYTEQESGVCVEPQTGPPDGLNTGDFTLVEPGRPLVATMRLRWHRPG
jgi:aldose 1-epimerase